MDILSKKNRSWVMSRIQGKNTGPEKQVGSLLHGLGYRFRLHRKDLPGRPDIVLPKHRTVIFVHGCFWHHHRGCKYAYKPKSRVGFWQKKFQENLERDGRKTKALKSLGWRVIVVWECELENPETLVTKIRKLLTE